VPSAAPSASLLAAIPQPLRDELLTAFSEIARNFRERRWEPSELNGGKFCEVAYSILRGLVDGSYPASASKPPNMVDACKAFEQADSSTFPRSVRIQIPRMIIALYEIRNNRGVGHVGGDVDPNAMDATCVLYMTKWVLAELVRIFHNIDISAAEAAVESIVERVLPQVWRVGKKLRVLDTTLSMKQKTLVLLYHSAAPLRESDLVDWVEHSNPSVYRRDVLRPLHDARLVEYDQVTRIVHISPPGIATVEELLLASTAVA
jgi:hypothetical protein